VLNKNNKGNPNSPTNKTPDHIAAAIRRDWLDGDAVMHIASRYGVSYGVVTRLCAKLRREEKCEKPLFASEINQLLNKSWGVVKCQ
jgi:hypothetical protein